MKILIEILISKIKPFLYSFKKTIDIPHNKF